MFQNCTAFSPDGWGGGWKDSYLYILPLAFWGQTSLSHHRQVVLWAPTIFWLLRQSAITFKTSFFPRNSQEFPHFCRITSFSSIGRNYMGIFFLTWLMRCWWVEHNRDKIKRWCLHRCRVRRTVTLNNIINEDHTMNMEKQRKVLSATLRTEIRKKQGRRSNSGLQHCKLSTGTFLPLDKTVVIWQQTVLRYPEGLSALRCLIVSPIATISRYFLNSSLIW